MKCPFCGKETAVYGDLLDYSFNGENYSAVFEMSCEECDGEWRREETYKLEKTKNIFD